MIISEVMVIIRPTCRGISEQVHQPSAKPAQRSSQDRGGATSLSAFFSSQLQSSSFNFLLRRRQDRSQRSEKSITPRTESALVETGTETRRETNAATVSRTPTITPLSATIAAVAFANSSEQSLFNRQVHYLGLKPADSYFLHCYF